jgi:glycosyltransferase involved in cell wall biosynthesis
MSKNIFVSIIMGVYNAELFLHETINSILVQSHTNFELVIINDKSTDGSMDIISSFSDKRIRVFTNDSNLGLSASLNKAIAYCKGKYFLRMDADDICFPNRVSEQVNFMENNPLIGISGTSYTYIGNTNLLTRFKVERALLNTEHIKARLIFGTALLHPSVIFRGSLIRKLDYVYDESYRTAQDYELWTRLILSINISNLDKPLLKYRLSNSQSTVTSNVERYSNCKKIQFEYLKNLLKRDPRDSEMELHSLINECNAKLTLRELEEVSNWLIYLVAASQTSDCFSSLYVQKECAIVWANSCNKTESRFSAFFKLFFTKKIGLIYNFWSLRLYAIRLVLVFLLKPYRV